MTKSLEIFPEELFRKGEIVFTPIPVCAYDKTPDEEKQLYSSEELVTIYHDMVALRTFETVINELKLHGEYNGVKYNHAGPAHLSMGQEAAAVGQAYRLDVNDHTFGSHRSHGEILAKGLSSINKLDEPEQRGLGGWAGIYEWGVYRCGVDDCICRYMAGADAFSPQWYADKAAISLKRMDAAIADGFQLLDEEKGAVESLRKAVDELRGEK